MLTSLADGPKHGYALINDIEGFAGVRLGPARFTAAFLNLKPLASSSPSRPRSAVTLTS